MAKDLASKVGITFAPIRFVVERGKIREFAMAIGDDNPLYYSLDAAQAAGFHDIPIPPTFATAIDMWGGADFFELMRVLELNPGKVLHGEQAYEYIKDVCAGDEVSGQTRVIAAETKSGMNLLTLETQFFNQDGELAFKSRSVVIERH